MMNMAVNWVALWARSFNKVGVVHNNDRNLVSWAKKDCILMVPCLYWVKALAIADELAHVASFARLDIEIGGGACTAQLVIVSRGHTPFRLRNGVWPRETKLVYFTWYVRAIWRELWQSQCGHDQCYCTVVCTVAYFKQGREGLTSEWVDRRTSRPWARKVGNGCLSWRAGSSCRPWEREHTASECFSF